MRRGGRSSCAAEPFYNDASLEAADQRAPNNSKNLQWVMKGDVCRRRLIPVPFGGVSSYSFLQAVGRTLVYHYRCTDVDFVNSSTSAAP
ncbi:uncharacterized protein TNCV_236811 [Trichonephila clavipes]|nr:uncharacterized protein TNCV_236811 [Trichonephila clavipes]